MDEWLSNLISELPFLEYIHIDRSMNLRSIKISSGSLKKLFFRSHDMLDEFELDTPNLGIFKYHGNLASFSSNTLALSKTTLFFNSDNIDSQLYGKLIELLATFNHRSNVLNLEYDLEAVIIARELQESYVPH